MITTTTPAATTALVALTTDAYAIQMSQAKDGNGVTIAAISSMLMGNRALPGVLASWPGLDNPKHSVAVWFKSTLGVVTKADYIQHRAALKQYLNLMAACQKSHKQAMSCHGGSSSAQTAASYGAYRVTMLIEMRRAGKVWSAAEADAKKAASIADAAA